MTNEQKNAVDALGGRAVEVAVIAAGRYAKAQGRELDLDVLSKTLRASLADKVAEGLKDAKDALDAGMPDVARSLVTVACQEAGIAAAKESLR